ncbi:hypothetical protein [Nostoc sp. CMAA1605]|uniref:hypothetical protein n=1 Tax=Nostoc sp. CMAA1605 TaxID=2055159 RepID=UPI001F35518C|nr:hypothetical protein [Nostoc sp. CMAA1605]
MTSSAFLLASECHTHTTQGCHRNISLQRCDRACLLSLAGAITLCGGWFLTV